MQQNLEGEQLRNKVTLKRLSEINPETQKVNIMSTELLNHKQYTNLAFQNLSRVCGSMWRLFYLE